MPKQKERYVILEAKTDLGKEKLSYHGDKWVFRGEEEKLKFIRTPGPFIIVRSRDGSKILCIRKEEDPDLRYRFV